MAGKTTSSKKDITTPGQTKFIETETATLATEAPKEKKSPAKKCEPKKAEVKSTTIIQFDGKSFLSCELKAKAIELWVAEGNKEKDLTETALYVNIDEAKVYYVINDTDKGSFDI